MILRNKHHKHLLERTTSTPDKYGLQTAVTTYGQETYGRFSDNDWKQTSSLIWYYRYISYLVKHTSWYFDFVLDKELGYDSNNSFRGRWLGRPFIPWFVNKLFLMFGSKYNENN